MKKYWREVLILILLIVAVTSIRKCSINKDDIELLSLKPDAVIHYKNKNGEILSQIKTVELTNRQLKKYGDQLEIDNKELKKQIGSLTNLVGYWKVRAQSTGAIQVKGIDTTFVYIDRPVVGKKFYWTNKYLTLDQFYNPLNDTLHTKYNYSPSFDLTAYRKGKNLFRQGTLVADVKFQDQSIVVNNFSGILIKEEKKRWYETKVAAFAFGGVVGTVGVIYLTK